MVWGLQKKREKKENIEKLMYKYIKYKLLYNKDVREIFGRVDGAATEVWGRILGIE